MLLEGNQLYRVPARRRGRGRHRRRRRVPRRVHLRAAAGESPAEILRFANAAAALSCTREGALNSVPTLREVERLLADDGERVVPQGNDELKQVASQLKVQPATQLDQKHKDLVDKFAKSRERN